MTMLLIEEEGPTRVVSTTMETRETILGEEDAFHLDAIADVSSLDGIGELRPGGGRLAHMLPRSYFTCGELGELGSSRSSET
ncbi:hypothetical protein MJO29_005650 [Puccinia striiformis f. sp. tritici]|nr:hypothetical protein MJO29_005650 [Puccinia striiformis f. sp. tritici]